MAISTQLNTLVREDANHRCSYCMTQQQYYPAKLEIEHIVPSSRGGTDERDNLCLACRPCNRHKSNKIIAVDPLTNQTVSLFNPRLDKWGTHFKWSERGTHIEGLTPVGRASVIALNLNNSLSVDVREQWVSVGWHPPK